MENNNASTGEILEAINEFSTNVDKRFTKIESDITVIKSDITVIKSDITTIKSTMVTKDYLDEKLGDLRGDLTLLMRKEDTKVAMLVKILRAREVITEEDKQQIFAMEPFPQMSV
ncbi:MAG: hypothetical protein WC862_02365 [Patescibacteria group bacterium]